MLNNQPPRLSGHPHFSRGLPSTVFLAQTGSSNPVQCEPPTSPETEAPGEDLTPWGPPALPAAFPAALRSCTSTWPAFMRTPSPVRHACSTVPPNLSHRHSAHLTLRGNREPPPSSEGTRNPCPPPGQAWPLRGLLQGTDPAARVHREGPRLTVLVFEGAALPRLGSASH